MKIYRVACHYEEGMVISALAENAEEAEKSVKKWLAEGAKVATPRYIAQKKFDFNTVHRDYHVVEVEEVSESNVQEVVSELMKRVKEV